MATITKQLKTNGELSYRAQVRVKRAGKIIFSEARSFPKEKLARDWATRLELDLKGHGAIEKRKMGKATIGTLISRYVEELEPTGKIGRTKSYVLESLLARPIAEKEALTLDAADVIQHCRDRQEEGAGPSTVLHDVSYLKSVLEHAKRVWSMQVSGRAVDEAMGTLHQLKLIGKSRARDRRPTEDELQRIFTWLESRQSSHNSFIPHVDIVRFAISSGMRAAEIERLRWDDLDEEKRLILVRQRKDPKQKIFNDQWVPLLGEAWDIVQAQPRNAELIFPYNIRSVTAAWQRACNDLGIQDLRFHDLRHEGISRLFEAGLSIQEVAMVSGHRSWNNLKRYTQLRPESLHSKFGGQIAPQQARTSQAKTEQDSCYMGEWTCQRDVLDAFGLRPKDIASITILFAAYFTDTKVFVVFREGKELFEVESDGRMDWLPEATTINSLRHRLKTGRLGKHGKLNLFADELLQVLIQQTQE